MKKMFLFVLCVICLILVSCNSGNSKSEPTHFAFKENRSDKWGLVDANGKVLVSNEFANKPSMVVNGMFFVYKEDKGIEMYSISKPLVSVGDVYKSIAPFTEDITPSVKKAEGIKFIDKQGNVKYELPFEYTRATNFSNGYSIVAKKEDGHSVNGVMNASGKMFFFKDYSIDRVLSDGTFVATKEDDSENTFILDSKGNVKYEIASNVVGFSPDLKYYVFEEYGSYGLKTIKGENVIRSKYDFLTFTEDGKLCFLGENNDSEQLGIMDIQEKVLVKQKYFITDYHDGLIIASKDDDTFGLLDLNEDRKLNFNYSSLCFIPNSKNMFAEKDGERGAFIIDRNGNEIADYYTIDFERLMADDLLTMYYELSDYCSLEWIESDYFDVASCIESILHPSGKSINDLYGFAGKTPSQCADMLNLSLSKDDIIDNNWFPDMSLENNEYGRIYYNLGFDEVVVTTYDSDDYYGWYPHYSYSSQPCDGLLVECILGSKAENHADQIREQIDDVLVRLGYSSFTDEGTVWFKNSNVRIRHRFSGDDRLLFTIYSL